MAIKRVVSVDFWTDEKVMDMFSAEDKYFMLYLLTNPHTTQLGIYKFNCKLAGFELGLSIETVKVLLDRFENKYHLIRYSATTQEIAIKNYLRHSVITGGTPVYDLLNKEIGQVKNKDLVHYVFSWLQKQEKLNLTVLKVVNEYFNNNNNNNNNDNEKSYNLSGNDSSDDSFLPKKIKSSRHKYGSYQNVLLSDEELKKLQTEFPSNWEEWIERVSEYVASKGKGYKDYLATIRSWARREKTKGGVTSGTHQRTTSALGKAKGNFDDLRNLI